VRAVLNREATVTASIDDEDGNLVAATAPPTVQILDGAGAVLYTGTSVASADVGRYTYVLPAQSKVDELTALFTCVVGSLTRVVTVNVSVTGARLIELHRLREDIELTDLSGKNLRRLVYAVEDWFESALGYPPVLRSKRATWRFDGGNRLSPPGVIFPKALYALSTNLIAYSTPELANVVVTRNAWEYATGGSVDFLSGTGSPVFRAGGQTTVWCAHAGPWDRQPADLTNAANTFARYLSRTNNYPERAAQVATEGALITFSVPSPDKPTGLPEVDAVITRLREQIVI
jgi:hypothetical protein